MLLLILVALLLLGFGGVGAVVVLSGRTLEVPSPTGLEPQTVAVERRAFTSTVTLAGTVDVAPSTDLRTLPPGTPVPYVVTAKVEPILLYRLPERPDQARVRIAGGPPEFSCATVELVTRPLERGGARPGGDASEDSAGPALGGFGPGSADVPEGPEGTGAEASAETVVRCAVPAGVRVFPGLHAEVIVTTARLADTLLVPAGAVETESAETGYVTVLGPGGREERRRVQIGPSDGSMVVVVSGLADGERVLDRVPFREEDGPPGFGGGGAPQSPGGLHLQGR